MARRWKPKHYIILAVCLGLFGWIYYAYIHVAVVAWRAGFFEKTEQHAYTGDTIANMQAIAGALKKYHESEGQFPPKEHWMDAVMKYLNSADLKPGEAEKKLHDPSLGAADYGYAMNAAIAGKYIDDLPEKDKTVVVYLTVQKSKDAVGDPKTDAREGKVIGVTFDGKIVQPPKS